MSPPNPTAPRTPSMADIVREEVRRATEGLRRELEDAQRHIGEANDKIAALEGVDANVHQTLGQVNERLANKSGAYKDLLGTVKKQSDSVVDVEERQGSAEGRLDRLEARTERIELKVDTSLRQGGIAQGMIQKLDSSVAKTTELSEGREGDFLIAQTKSKLAFEEMKRRVFWGAVVAIVLGVVTTVTNAVVTLKRSDAIEQHVDERIRTTNERLERALPK